ncbi:hypothetical protein Aduo_018614 [Ancylostoma duodenale]
MKDVHLVPECRLKKLSLRGNPFTEIPRAVNSLDELEDLDISNTNIPEFHAQSLMLDELGIGGNPINCTCETSFLLEDEYYSYEYTNAIPKCAAPPELKGRPFTKVAQADACPAKASAERSGRFAGIFMMLLILVFCTVGVYFCIITKRWEAIVRHIQNPPLSYSNLASKEDQQGLEQDFQPRPQDV